MTMLTEPRRGRAATNFRPGRFIRDYLARVDSASISKIHRDYKAQYFRPKVNRHGESITRTNKQGNIIIVQEPILNSRGAPYRWPTYESFVQVVAKLRRLELLAVVERAPTPDQISAELGWRGHKERAETAFYALPLGVNMQHPAWDSPTNYPEPSH